MQGDALRPSGCRLDQGRAGMTVLLEQPDPDFAAGFRGWSTAAARRAGRRSRCGPRHPRRGAARRRCRADRLTAAVRPAPALTATGCAYTTARSPRRERAARPSCAEALESAAAGSGAFHERQLPEDTSYSDAARRPAGPALAADRRGRALCAGGTAAYPSSVLMNAIPAKVAGVRARGDGRADARRAAQPAGPGRRAHRRRRRDLPDRRRPGGGGAGLRDGNDPRRSTRSSGPATPMSRRPSGRFSAGSVST